MMKCLGNDSGKPKLDPLDMRLLAEVAERGRQTMRQLSKKVGLSSTPCTARLERLEGAGLILAYHADVAVEKLAELSLYVVTIAGAPYTPGLARRLEPPMSTSPYIVSAEALFGSLDYLLRIYAHGADHYHEIMEPFTACEIDYQTWPVARCVLRPRLHR